MVKNLLAQTVNFGGQTIEGPLQDSSGNSINNIGQLTSRVLSFLLPLAGIVLLFVFIWGGYDYMMSQGNPEKVKGAQAKITSGIIGLILLVASYLLVRVISTIFGLGTGIL